MSDWSSDVCSPDLDHRGAVHLARAGEGFQRIWPRLRRAQLQHRVQALADLLVTIEGAAVERPLPARLVARGLVELELEQPRQEIAGVGRVDGNVELRAGKIGRGSWRERVGQ